MKSLQVTHLHVTAALSDVMADVDEHVPFIGQFGLEAMRIDLGIAHKQRDQAR